MGLYRMGTIGLICCSAFFGGGISLLHASFSLLGAVPVSSGVVPSIIFLLGMGMDFGGRLLGIETFGTRAVVPNFFFSAF